MKTVSIVADLPADVAGNAGKLDIQLTSADQGQSAQPVERAAILPQFA